MPKDEFDRDDPLELVGFVAPHLTDADVAEMTDNIVDEYVRFGWGDDEILALFHSPAYRLTHSLYRVCGDPPLRDALCRARERWAGLWRVRTEESACPDDGPDALGSTQLLSITTIHRPGRD